MPNELALRPITLVSRHDEKTLAGVNRPGNGSPAPPLDFDRNQIIGLLEKARGHNELLATFMNVADRNSS